MDTSLIYTILLSSVLAATVCVVSTWLRPARRFDADESPMGFPTGGLAFVIALVAALAGLSEGRWREGALAVCVCAVFLFTVGTMSEILPVVVGRLVRLASLVVTSAFAVFVGGLSISEVKLPFGPVVPLGVAADWLAVLWVFAVAMLVSLSNRGEALVPGIAVLSGLTLSAVAAIAGTAAVSVPGTHQLGMAVTGAALPVLWWCNPPPRVRFGLGAGMSAGIALACLSVLGAVKNAAFLVLVVPALCLGAPLYASMITLAINRDRPLRTVFTEAERVTFVGALVRRGMNAREAVAFLLAWHVYLCLMALLLTVAIRQSWVLKLLILLVLGGLGAAGFAITFQIVYGWRAKLRQPGAVVDSITILGTRIDRTTMRDAMERVLLWSTRDHIHHVVTADATLVDRASREPEFDAIVRKATLVTPDGAGALFAARLLGAPFPERVAGADLTVEVCGEAARRGVPVYFLGAKPGVAKRAVERLLERFPGLKVAGVRHGYFDSEEEERIVGEIAGSGARILLAGLGVPHQERFVERNRDRLGVGVVIGVGGTFDVLSGEVTRAPEWMQRAGLEWLWRVMQDPRRLPRLAALPRFFVRVLAYAVGWRGRNHAPVDGATLGPLGRS